MPDAAVTLCQQQQEARIRVNEGWPDCEKQLGFATTTTDGSFELRPSLRRPMPSGVNLVIRRVGYATRVVSGSELHDHSSAITVVVDAEPSIHGRFITSDSSSLAISNAEYGWFVQEGYVLYIRYLECCTGPTGHFESELPYIPRGVVWVFAIEPKTGRYGLAPLGALHSDAADVTLEATRTLHTIAGRVETPDGGSLAGTISATPAHGEPIAFDRVLGAIQGGRTSATGTFVLRLASSGEFQVNFGTWAVGSGTRQSHAPVSPLTTTTLTDAEQRSDLVLRTKPEPLVMCQLVDPTGVAVAIDELGLSFGPHLGWAHSDSCVAVKRAQDDATAGASTEVRFVWPRGADNIRVRARSIELKSHEAPSHSEIVEGVLTLRLGEDKPCIIHGAPETHD